MNNCYFEGVGGGVVTPSHASDGKLVHVDDDAAKPPFYDVHIVPAWQVTIHDNIFRGKRHKGIAINSLFYGHIYDNQIQNLVSFVTLKAAKGADKEAGQDRAKELKVEALAEERQGLPKEHLTQLKNTNERSNVRAVVVEGNGYYRIKLDTLLMEEKPGLIERAILEDCVFKMHPKHRNTCQGSPLGKVRPQYLGHEILDIQSKTWFKAIGPKNTD